MALMPDNAVSGIDASVDNPSCGRKRGSRKRYPYGPSVLQTSTFKSEPERTASLLPRTRINHPITA